MSKHRFPKEVLRFFNLPQPKVFSKNNIPRIYAIAYPLHAREQHIPAVAKMGKDGKKHYYPAW